MKITKKQLIKIILEEAEKLRRDIPAYLSPSHEESYYDRLLTWAYGEASFPIAGEAFSVKQGVNWNDLSKDTKKFVRIVAGIAKQMYGEKGRRMLVITDGARTPREQVDRIATKLKKGETPIEVMSLYSPPTPGMSQQTQKIITNIVDLLKKDPDDKEARRIAEAFIKSGIRKNAYLSSHLLGDAVDFRSTNYKDEIKELLDIAAQKYSDIYIEDETSAAGGAHWHVVVRDTTRDGEVFLSALADQRRKS